MGSRAWTIVFLGIWARKGDVSVRYLRVESNGRERWCQKQGIKIEGRIGKQLIATERACVAYHSGQPVCPALQSFGRCYSAMGEQHEYHGLPLSMPCTLCRDSIPVDSFAERLRRQDEAFRAALDNKAFETGIREVQGDAADDALRRLLDARDQAQASH